MLDGVAGRLQLCARRSGCGRAAAAAYEADLARFVDEDAP